MKNDKNKYENLSKEQLINLLLKAQKENKILEESLGKALKLLQSKNEEKTSVLIKLLKQLADRFYPKSDKTKVITKENKLNNEKISEEVECENKLNGDITKTKTHKTFAGNRDNNFESLKNNPFVEYEEKIIKLDDLSCPDCGHPLVEDGEKTINKLEIENFKIKVINYVIKKYKCSYCSYKTEAELIDPFYKSYNSPSFSSYVSTFKFMYGMPLYRLSKMFESQNIKITRQFMCKSIMETAFQLEPIYNGLHKELLKSNILHVDETTLRVLELQERLKSYMYIYASSLYENPIAIYKFEEDRKAENSIEFLKGFKGYLVCDDYAGYNNIPNTKLCRCWFHARKKFNDLIKVLPKIKDNKSESQAMIIVDKINKIFDVNNKIYDDDTLTFNEKNKLQKQNLIPLIDDYFSYIKSIKDSAILDLKAAINYSIKIEADLRRFLEDPRIPMTNNRAERLVKTFVIDRKNFLFSESCEGAKTSAILLSLCQTAMLNGVDPQRYIEYLLSNLDKIKPSNMNDYYPFSNTLKENIEKLKRHK